MFIKHSKATVKSATVILLVAILMSIGFCEQSVEADSTVFQQDITPFLKQYCYHCHGVEKQKADVNFQTLPPNTEIYKNRDLWELVRDLLLEDEMPPSKSDQPSAEDRQRIIELIGQELDQFDCDAISNPGRVTIRRLNRAEYDNTIRDLMGVDFHPADDFPLDEVGYGFDNIGDVLSLSPILMEKYLNAAESVVTNALLAELPPWPPSHQHQVEKFTADQDDIVRAEGSFMGFYREGNAFKKLLIEQTGEYKISVRAHGQQAGPDHAKLELALGDGDKYVIDVDAFADRPKVYAIQTTLSKGTLNLKLSYLNNYNVQDHPIAELNGDRNLFVDYVEIKGPINVQPPSLPVTHSRVIPGRPEPGEEVAYAREILSPFVKRAYRRPATEDELDRLTGLVEYAMVQEATFEKSMQVAIQAVLTSPHFLFRWELDPTDKQGDDTRALNDFELASRLSYFLWSSMPDDELLNLAEAGLLRDDDVLSYQVERMLQDPKSDALVTNFAGQWLQFRSLDTVTPDPAKYPSFTPALRDAMLKESELFFTEIMRSNRELTDFLDADFTYLNETLANHYGIEGVHGDTFQRVSLDASSRRGGVLTQGSILTLTSNPTRTSPVLRGKWILEQILGTPPPPPPPDVPMLEETQEAALSGSLRERLEQHRSKPDCATCHEKMDPIGFAFENFNAIGQWRDLDAGFQIDPAGTLPDGTQFEGATDLIAELKTRDTFVHSVIEKMLTFALGRGLEYYDQCTTESIFEEVTDNHLKFQALVKAVVLSNPFQLRNQEGNES